MQAKDEVTDKAQSSADKVKGDAEQAALTTALANIRDFGVVYSSTVIRWQGLPQ